MKTAKAGLDKVMQVNIFLRNVNYSRGGCHKLPRTSGVIVPRCFGWFEFVHATKRPDQGTKYRFARGEDELEAR